MKTCNKCHRELSLDLFAKHPTRRQQSTCKECQRSISKTWYENNKKRQVTNVRRNNTKYLAEFNVWKAKQSCQTCGENRAPCLDFHHLDPAQKELELSDSRGIGRVRLAAELRKCVCLCSNCHRLVHAGLLSLPENINTCRFE